MTPTAKTPTAPVPASNLVDNIPVHDPGQPPAPRNEDAELDKIMQDVGHELRKDDGPKKKHHFWELDSHHKKEANFSTQKSIQNVPHPAAASPKPASAPQPQASAPRPQAPNSPAPHTRIKPAAQTPAKAPKPSKQSKHHLPVMVTFTTVLITAALIAAAYYAYK